MGILRATQPLYGIASNRIGPILNRPALMCRGSVYIYHVTTRVGVVNIGQTEKLYFSGAINFRCFTSDRVVVVSEAACSLIRICALTLFELPSKPCSISCWRSFGCQLNNGATFSETVAAVGSDWLLLAIHTDQTSTQNSTGS